MTDNKTNTSALPHRISANPARPSQARAIDWSRLAHAAPRGTMRTRLGISRGPRIIPRAIASSPAQRCRLAPRCRASEARRSDQRSSPWSRRDEVADELFLMSLPWHKPRRQHAAGFVCLLLDVTTPFDPSSDFCQDRAGSRISAHDACT